MNDQPAEDELGPHGKPIPPSTWTPEREAKVAAWRDELMAAGEHRDIERIEQLRGKLSAIANGDTTVFIVAVNQRVDLTEIRYWLDMWKYRLDPDGFVAEAEEAKEKSNARRNEARLEARRQRIEKWCRLISERRTAGATIVEIAKELNMSRAGISKFWRHYKEHQCTSPSSAPSASDPTPSTCEPTSQADRQQTIA